MWPIIGRSSLTPANLQFRRCSSFEMLIYLTLDSFWSEKIYVGPVVMLPESMSMGDSLTFTIAFQYLSMFVVQTNE